MKSTKSKKTLYLVLTLSTAALFFASLAVFSILGKKYPIFSNLLVLDAIVFVIILLFLQRKLSMYILIDQHERLFSNITAPLPSLISILSTSWIKKLNNEGYQLYKENPSASIYYSLKLVSNRKRDRTLFLVVIIRDERISFENEPLSELIGEIELELFKKERYRHRIYLQFKEYKNETPELNESTHDIIWTKQGRRSVTLINACNYIEDKKVFFVYNEDFSPTIFYRLGTEEILRLTNNGGQIKAATKQ